VKSITITIPEALDRAAAAEAKRRGISKSELIRLGLNRVLPGETSNDERDVWIELAGFASDTVTTSPGEIDEVVYGS
jgi:hypothetical protein